VRQLNIDPTRVSLFINGIRPLPEKHHNKLSEILKLTPEELRALANREEVV